MDDNGVMATDGKWEKLERPGRVLALDPEGTLTRVGVGAHDTVCDIGAGSGLFSFAAAARTDGTVYAVDTDHAVLARLTRKTETTEATNVKAVPADGLPYPLSSHSVDLALMVTVLHEIGDKDALIAEVVRLLKPDGRFCVVEFRKDDVCPGPPLQVRLSPQQVQDLLAAHGLTLEDNFDIGTCFYCQTYVSQ